MSQKQLHFNLFIHSRGHHEASWRHPDASPRSVFDVAYYQDLARTAEAGLFDSIFFADQLALGDEPRTYRPEDVFGITEAEITTRKQTTPNPGNIRKRSIAWQYHGHLSTICGEAIFERNAGRPRNLRQGRTSIMDITPGEHRR